MGSVLILTTKALNYTGYDIVSSFKDLDVLSYDCIVYHSSNDLEVDIASRLGELKDKDKKVLCICENLSSLLYTIFICLGADIYNEESYLEDVGVLEYLIGNYHKNNQMTIRTPESSLDSLNKFLSVFEQGDTKTILSMISSKLWLQNFASTVQSIREGVLRTNNVGSDVLEVVSQTNNAIEELRKTLEERDIKTTNEMTELYQLLASLQNDVTSKASDTVKNTSHFYGEYRVPQLVNKVLYVRIMDECLYLPTLLQAYQKYLKVSKQTNSKILILSSKMKLNISKYMDLTHLDPQTLNVPGISTTPLTVSFEPTKAVLDEWFKDNAITKVYIVIDYFKDEGRLKGVNVEETYGLKVMKSCDIFNVPRERSFVPISASSSMLYIPHLNNFNKQDEIGRQKMYVTKAMDTFKKIDNLLAIR